MAQINHITLNFDSNITEIKEWHYSGTVTTSGQSIEFPGTNTNFSVTLTDGYILNTVVASSGTISDITSNSFKWTFGDSANITITLTSKRSNTMRKQIDLTTLPGWANLSSGNHTIKIKAKGTGYKESELSAGVTVSKAASTVTLSAGTYKFVDSPTFTSSFNETVSYASNNVDWDKFRVNAVQNIITYGIPNTNAYVNRAWANTAYQTITLATDQQVSQEFYTWFTANANKDYTLEAGTYKWVGNPNIAAGYFNSVVGSEDITLSFQSNSVNYDSISLLYATGTGYTHRRISYDSTMAYRDDFDNGTFNARWINDAYRTIIISTPQIVYAKFYKWAITDGNLVKQATGETWLLNNDLSSANNISVDVNFISNNTECTKFNYTSSKGGILTYIVKATTEAMVVYTASWNSTAYRTVTFETAPTGDLLTWLQANGTKQAAAKKVTLSLDGDPGYIPTPIDIYQCDDDKGTNKELVTTITSSADDNKVITVTKAYLYYLGGYGGYTKVDGDMTFHITWDSCLTGDTLVTMFDKSEKRLDEIEVGDKVLSVDFDMKQHIVSEVVYTDKNMNKHHTEYDLWIFSDGTEIKTVHKHEFYNLEAKRMKYIDEWKIGEHTLKVDGTHPALVEHKNIKEVAKHYKITLDGNTAYFANGLLTGDRHCPKNKEL
jgi:hypothetical protein